MHQSCRRRTTVSLKESQEHGFALCAEKEALNEIGGSLKGESHVQPFP